MRRPKYQLSPNEVERFVKEDQDRRRKLRLVQVREQSKANAEVIRNDVRREKERLLDKFAAEIKEQLDAEKEEKVRKLEQKYENTLRMIGEGHREVLINGDGEKRAEKLQRQVEDAATAEERYKLAIQRQRKEDSDKEYEKTKHILARQAALEKEKKRAADVASLPPPPPDICVELEKTKKRAIHLTDMKAFATTHYHIPDYHVVRAGSEEQMYDARTQAQESDLKLTQDLQEKKRSQHERVVRARIRGNEALQKEMLKHEYENMLKDLSLLQKRDRRMRKQMLADIPKQVFLPPERLLEERNEKQRQMEDKFHEIFQQHSEVTPENLRSYEVLEHISVHSVESPTSPGPRDLSISLSRVNPALRDLTNFSKPVETLEMKKPETVLKQLLNRIKDQRDGTVADQKAASAGSVKEKLMSNEEVQGGTLAANKAFWERAHEDSPDRFVTEHMFKLRDQGVIDTTMTSDPGLVKGSNTERMIDDLRRRIDLIESQKSELAQQIKAQANFYSNFMRKFQEDENLSVDIDSCTLEEVDIEPSNNSQVERNNENDNYLKVLPETVYESHSHFNISPVQVDGAYVGQASGSALWPTTTRGRDDVMGRSHLREVGYDLQSKIGFGTQTNGYSSGAMKAGEIFDGGDFGQVKGQQLPLGDSQRLHQSMPSLDMRHMTSLGYGTMGTVNNKLAGQGHMMNLGYNDNWKVGPGRRSDSKDINLIRRVKEYTDSAWKRQAGVDSETMKKVREYQERLLQVHEERKKHLASIRSDIENRRRELATGKPATSLETGNLRQTVAEGLINSKGDSQAAGQRDKPEGDVVGNYQRWKANQLGPSSTNLTALQKTFKTSGELEVKTITGSAVEHIAAYKQQEKNLLAGNEQHVGTRQKDVIDTVRKSLSFDDVEESFNVSHTSWKDVLNDADNTQFAQALTEDSKITSSEEERGSPILAHGCLVMLSKSSSSVNDSMGNLNGSALLVKAQERKLGFEHRQEELQKQLMDIQRQKDSIMQAYYAGQKALQHQQVALMSKLANVSSVASEDNRDKQRLEMRAKLADIRSQIDADARGRTIYQETEAASNFAGVGHGKEVRSSSAQDLANLDEACGKSKESLDMGRRASQQSVGTPINLSSDSYLAEISFHKINTSADQNTSSAFQAVMPGSASTRTLSASHQTQSQTWASILSLSANNTSHDQQWQQQSTHEGSLIEKNCEYGGQFQGTNSQEQSQANFNQPKPSRNSDQSLMADKSVTFVDTFNDHHTSPPPSTSTIIHQPHELSTIMEVDTPISSSARTAVARLVTSVNTTDLAHTTNSMSFNDKSSNSRVDVFMDLPYTFLENRHSSLGPSSALYNLTLGQTDSNINTDIIPKSNMTLESVIPGYQKQTGAKRSLDFSEHLFTTGMPPAIVELTPQKSVEVHDLDYSGRGFEPENTLSHGYNVSDESSFKISGYSDYLRHEDSRAVLEESADSDYLRHEDSRAVLEESADSDYLRHEDSRAVLEESADSDYLRHEDSRAVLEESADNPGSLAAKCDVVTNSGGSSTGGIKSDSRFGYIHHPQGYSQEVVESLRKRSEIVFGALAQEGNSN